MTNEPTAEQKEKGREVALKNLENPLFWKYATPKLVNTEQYGMLSKLAGADYQNTLSQTPEQSVYEQLFYPQLVSEGGAITSPYLQKKSISIIQQSILMLKVEDLPKLIGTDKSIKEIYAEKYISELPEEKIKDIISSYMSFKTPNIATELLKMQENGAKNTLEKLLCESEEENNMPNAA